MRDIFATMLFFNYYKTMPITAILGGGGAQCFINSLQSRLWSNLKEPKELWKIFYNLPTALINLLNEIHSVFNILSFLINVQFNQKCKSTYSCKTRLLHQQGNNMTHIKFSSNLVILQTGDQLVNTSILEICADYELFFKMTTFQM